jgi:hypothetical protein
MVSFWREVLKTPGIWVEWNLVAEGRAHLPGARGPNADWYLEKAPASYLPYQPPASIPVPLAYRGPSGGFCVSALFKARTKPSLRTDTRTNQPTSTYEQALASLACSEQPILDSSWHFVGAASTTVHEHSFLYMASKRLNLTKSETLPPPRHQLQSAWFIPRAPISSPSADGNEKRHEFDIGDMACPNVMVQTNIYKRRR